MRCRMLWVVLVATLLIGCATEPEPVTEQPNKKASGPRSVEGVAASAEDATVTFDDAGGRIDLAKITLTAPKGWRRKPPSSGFLIAEYELPRVAEDSADARLTVAVAGGTVEENIDRWRKQFGGKPARENGQEIDASGIKITTVDFSGEFDEQRGPMAPATKRAGYRMLAATIPVDGELHFLKCTGPEKTVAAHAEEFTAFARSVQRK